METVANNRQPAGGIFQIYSNVMSLSIIQYIAGFNSSNFNNHNAVTIAITQFYKL